MAYRFNAEKYEADRIAREAERERVHLAQINAMKPEHGLCYFVDTGEGHIKIGFSRSLSSRMRDLKRDMPGLVLLASINGGFEREKYYHDMFAKYRVYGRGELFDPAPAILAEIERLGAGA